MKKTIFYLAVFMCIIAAVSSCGKAVVGETEDAPLLDPARTDLNAGTWKPILLTAPGDIAVPAPAAVNTPDYRAQLNEIKSYQRSMNGLQKEQVRWWGAGAVLRWNEILRGMVARYNLPPVQNPDGTYPFPDAGNPLAYPLFPFANPPYAARAYAYVAAAQYDALVTAWHYKTLYNRSAPYRYDSTLQVLVPRSELPSYPSEDAVVIGVTVEMMKLLFPGEQAYIQQKAEEHRRARILSGANVRSDLEAGEALGREVAQRFVARARTDKAGASIGNALQWQQLEDDCKARGEIPWMSMETPKRPPMLPLFGKVKTFLFDSATAVSLRPGPPPSTGSAQFRAETEEVYRVSSKATRDQLRMVHFWADGIATPTPPGHWNAIAAADFIGRQFSEVRWARNLALLNMSLMDAAIVCWDTKYFYFNPRPSQVDPRIKTLTGLPNFPAYISGHSTFSGAAAAILGHIIPERSAAYTAMAKEASESRILGGLHFRSDCEVGMQVGERIGGFAVARARTDGAE
jgi:hypothetical protein